MTAIEASKMAAAVSDSIHLNLVVFAFLIIVLMWVAKVLLGDSVIGLGRLMLSELKDLSRFSFTPGAINIFGVIIIAIVVMLYFVFDRVKQIVAIIGAAPDYVMQSGSGDFLLAICIIGLTLILSLAAVARHPRR